MPAEGRIWLDRRHPDYAVYAPHWEFLRDSYEGAPDFAARHLFRYWREDEGSFNDRRTRAHRENYTKRIVDLLTAYLHQEAPARRRDNVPDWLTQLWADANREGLSIDAFMAQHVSPRAATYGYVAIVVDRPAETAESRAEQREKRLFPYLITYAPDDVLDARWTDGQLDWVLLRERIRDDEDPKLSSGALAERYRLWTRHTWELWRIDVQDLGDRGQRRVPVLEQGPIEHRLGEVPVVFLVWGRALRPLVAPSPVSEVAVIDRAVMNYDSLLDDILYNAGFPQLRIPWEAIPPGYDQAPGQRGTTAEDRIIEMSLKRAFTYMGTAQHPPEWFAPDSGPASVLMERIKSKIDAMFRALGLSGELAEEETGASGISKEHAFRKLDKLLAAAADNHEAAERRIVHLAALWMEDRIERLDNVVDYPETFDVKTLAEELADIKGMMEAGFPDQVVNEARKEAARRRFAKLPSDQLMALMDAIDQQVGIPTIDIEAEEERHRREAAERTERGEERWPAG